jgi:serine/threonine protein kinase
VPQIGPYVLDRLLGKGGLGDVWKARDASLGRDVALKLLSVRDEEDVRRFVREAQTAAALDHPNIAPSDSPMAPTTSRCSSSTAPPRRGRSRSAWPRASFRGLARRALRQVDAALVDYAEAIRLAPADDAAYINRALLRRDMKDFQGAMEDADAAVRLDPDDPRNLSNRGFIRRDAGDRQGAIDDLTRALRIAPPEWPQRAYVESRLSALRGP